MIEEIRNLAYRQAEKLEYVLKDSPLDTLRTIKFNIQTSQFIDQMQFVLLNLELDSKSCLGRAAQAAAIAEKHFPEANLKIAEVWQDLLAGIMLTLLYQNPNKQFDPSFMQELLMYEEPHLVLMVNGVQFEPLSLQLGHDIQHPRIQPFPLWEGITASVLVSKAWLEPKPEKKLEILQQAEKICPGIVLIRENMCEPLELLGRIDEVIETAKWCLKHRPCARTLYVLCLLTGEQKYYNELTRKYSEEIIKYF